METLLQQLRTILSKGAQGREEEIRSHLSSYTKAGHLDWHQYRLFAPCKYSRNLVEINLDFECIVICWDENQESPIHNHTAQNCWFAVLEGNVEEIHFSYDEKTSKLTEGRGCQYSCGDVSWIKDDIALHKVRSVGGKACTLHIYSRPIPYCNIYDPQTGEVTQRKCGFFSVKGTKQCSEGTATYLELYRQIEEMIQNVPSQSSLLPPSPSQAEKDSSKAVLVPSIMSFVEDSKSCASKEEFSAW